MALDDLYRDVILDHYRNPRHRGSLPSADVHSEGQNPTCGDEFALDLAVEDGIIVAAGTEGRGCSISQASGSMMTEAIIGKTVDEARDIMHRVKVMMGIEAGTSPIDPERPGAELGDLEALQGVRRFPVRIKCADLPWTTLEDALAQWGDD
jgi:nitrogen fixation NifU-like protein